MGLWSKLMSRLGGGAFGAAGGDYYASLLGLAAAETIAFSAIGKYVQSVGQHVTFGGQYLLAITSTGRLVLGDLQTMSPALAKPFTRGTVEIQDRGYLDEDGGIVTGRGRYTQAGPTGAMENVKILEFTPQHAEPFSLFAVESAVPRILQWCAPG